MNRRVFKPSALEVLRGLLTPVVFTGLVVFIVVYGLNQAEESSRAEGARMLKQSLDRAIVTCYAVEGSYPPSVEYIEERYGVSIDRDKYIVAYEPFFSSSIMPSVTVFQVGSGAGKTFGFGVPQ
ncbi:MAG: hypothetical protein LBS19_11185 [Clostridiales bacterium]|jgi:hypothetical protein|nr:hypothetical protein [Clostridiales bacterium]